MSKARHAAWLVAVQGQQAARRARRTAFLLRLQATAKLAGATLDVDVAEDVSIGRSPRITVEPGSHNVVHIGPGSELGDDVGLQLKGGALLMGPRCSLRHRVQVNLAGTFVLEADNHISWGSVIHCSHDVRLEPMSGLAEQVTIADSSHFFTTPDEHFWHNVKKGSVRIGRNTWICPKATLTRGADVGSYCIVGAGSVVTGIVPDGHLASGVPAVTRALTLPWEPGS